MNRWSKLLGLALLTCLLVARPAAAQEEEEMDPLGDVIADMQVAGGRLGKLLTDKPTQQKQKDAVDKLDALIKLLEEQRGQQGQGQGLPDEPLNDSRIVSGPGGVGEMHDARRNGRSWGTLPAHKREQILQSMTEGFPAHYQQLLERYFIGLAEEKPIGDVIDQGPAASKKDAESGTKPATSMPAKTAKPAMEKPAAVKPAAAKPTAKEPATP